MTSNQINYWKMRNDMLHNEAVRAETQRVNNINAELKRVDQQLQADLNAINAKYKEKQYQLDKRDMEFQHRMSEIRSKQAARQLEIDAGRVQATMQANYINQLAQQEIARSNRVREEQNLASINESIRSNVAKENMQRALVPYQQSQLQTQTSLNQSHVALTKTQTKTESAREANVKSQTFSNYANPFINALTGVLRVIGPTLLAQ